MTERRLIEVIESLAGLIVREPGQVRVQLDSSNPFMRVVNITCNPSDVGRLIGVGGSRIKAFSNIASMIALHEQWTVIIGKISGNEYPPAGRHCDEVRHDHLQGVLSRCCGYSLGCSVDSVVIRESGSSAERGRCEIVVDVDRENDAAKLSRDLTTIMVGAREKVGGVIGVHVIKRKGGGDDRVGTQTVGSADASCYTPGTVAVPRPEPVQSAPGVASGPGGERRPGRVSMRRLGVPASKRGAAQKGRFKV